MRMNELNFMLGMELLKVLRKMPSLVTAYHIKGLPGMQTLSGQTSYFFTPFEDLRLSRHPVLAFRTFPV